ncbi:hypothetical protein [Arsenophonus endosymbiont of Bemisia tabaci]|uniref:hypothetical protein n=1 Tax=Arsenophonus endosymbiont of Bemisia tabaci TaxID=536059 RepID=UPI001EE37510|nr:hypothetical protein [Arsenophonus endosymbiont of Bemisia tabaci]
MEKNIYFVIKIKSLSYIIIIMSATKRFFDQRRQDVINDNSPIISYQVEVIDKKDIPILICVLVNERLLLRKLFVMKFIFSDYRLVR